MPESVMEDFENRERERLLYLMVDEMIEIGEPRDIFYDEASDIVDAVFADNKPWNMNLYAIGLTLTRIAHYYLEPKLAYLSLEQIEIFLNDHEARRALLRRES